MALIGRLHPLLIHFPIAVALLAAAAELVSTITADERWRRVAVGHVRAAAVFALFAAIAGWRLSSDLVMDAAPILEWHRWLAVSGLAAACAAALTGGGTAPLPTSIYRISLFAAGTL